MICGACQTEVPDTARRCPHCTTHFGWPWWAYLLTVAAATLIALLISSAIASNAGAAMITVPSGFPQI